jgi:hypothetical protein
MVQSVIITGYLTKTRAFIGPRVPVTMNLQYLVDQRNIGSEKHDSQYLCYEGTTNPDILECTINIHSAHHSIPTNLR